MEERGPPPSNRRSGNQMERRLALPPRRSVGERDFASACRETRAERLDVDKFAHLCLIYHTVFSSNDRATIRGNLNNCIHRVRILSSFSTWISRCVGKSCFHIKTMMKTLYVQVTAYICLKKIVALQRVQASINSWVRHWYHLIHVSIDVC
jgi:hypothetical protein